MVASRGVNDEDGQVTLSSKDKVPNARGGFQFRHVEPLRHVATIAGTILVPASAADLPHVPEQHVLTIEKALTLLANLLSDPDHQSYMGNHAASNRFADVEAAAIRRVVVAGSLRSILGLSLRLQVCSTCQGAIDLDGNCRCERQASRLLDASEAKAFDLPSLKKP